MVKRNGKILPLFVAESYEFSFIFIVQLYTTEVILPFLFWLSSFVFPIIRT